EKNFTKDQIFELYANQVYLGHGAYGVEAASRLYFGKHAKDLTTPEAETIAGLIRRPMAYSPILNPDSALHRRNHVLRRLLDEKYINRQQYEQALSAPIVLGTYKEESPKIGAYFSEEIRQYIEKSEKFGVENLYQRGLKVYTTLDLRMQQAAETVLQRWLRAWDRRRGFRRPTRNIAAEGLDPENYKDQSWSADPYVTDKLYAAVVMVVNGKGVAVRVNRDLLALPPSSFKWTQHDTMQGILKRGDIVSIQRALELSINVPAVKTWMMVGADRVVDFAKRCGITSPIPRWPATALGAAGISPMEMTAAYNVFANQGVYVKPRLVRKIV